MKIALATVGGLITLFALSWALMGNGFLQYKFFAPKEEQVRRDTFEQSKAYRQGTVQELQQMQFEYVKAAADQKAAIADIILHRAADYTGPMPADLQLFISQLRSERIGQ